jgi:hypothetical protein
MRMLAAVAALVLASPAVGRADTWKTGVVPGVLLGPHLNLISLPPGAGLEVRTLSNQLGFSFDFGWVPPVTVSNARASWTDLSLGARWYPFASAFYVGARGGQRGFKATAKDTTAGSNLEAKATVTGTYLAPELGWRFSWQSGFFMGIELGYQFILSHTETLDVPGGIDPKTQADVSDAADVIGKTGLPVLTLLQLGYYF